MITERLAALLPGYVIHPLSVDLERSWMLLPNHGGSLLFHAPYPRWEETFRRRSA